MWNVKIVVVTVLRRLQILYLFLNLLSSSVTCWKPDPASLMRAWTCHGQNQLDLVERLCQAQIVKTPAVREVLCQVDRQNYVPTNPYMDTPQAIGLGQTISAPHMHAHALEEIYPFVKDAPGPLKMLDVGCGSGYLTAALGRWVHTRSDAEGASPQATANGTSTTLSTAENPTILRKGGKVYAIDVYQHLVDMTTKNIEKQDSDLLKSGTVTVSLGDGWKGLPQHAPFDAIHVGAAADDLPVALVTQLKVGGVLIVPVGPRGDVQNLYRVERIRDSSGPTSGGNNGNNNFVKDDYKISRLLAVRYVPLVHATPDSG